MLYDLPASLVEWDLPRAFLSLVQTKNADIAASELGISGTTLRRRLARFEDLVGAKLYRGHSAGVVLTDAGAALADTLFEVDGILGTIHPNMANPPEQEKPPAKLWMPDVLFETFFLKLVSENAAFFHNYQLVLMSGDMPDVSHLAPNDIVLAHFTRDSALTENFPVGFHQLGFGATSEYMERFGTPAPHNLEAHHLALVSDYRLIRPIWSGLDTILLQVGCTLELNSTAACHVLARKGHHFTIVTQWSSRGTYLTCPEMPTMDMHVYLSVRKKFLETRQGNELTQLMLRESRDYFRREDDWPACRFTSVGAL